MEQYFEAKLKSIESLLNANKDRIQQAEKNSSQPKKKVKQEPQIIINQIHPQWVQTEVNQSNAQDNQFQQQENHQSSLKQTDPDNYNEENQDFVINKMEITNSMASTPQFLQTFEVEVRDENALPGESFVQKEKKIKEKQKGKKIKKQLDKQEKIDAEKKKKLRRHAGNIWEDPSLEEWPDNDYRLFVGNIGNEVSDEALANAFRKYKSFKMAKIVRERRSLKSKGYGFVSLVEPQDFLKALTEMNGKYIGNRPCQVKKSDWQRRNMEQNSSVIYSTFKKPKKKVKFKAGSSTNQNNQ